MPSSRRHSASSRRSRQSTQGWSGVRSGARVITMSSSTPWRRGLVLLLRASFSVTPICLFRPVGVLDDVHEADPPVAGDETFQDFLLDVAEPHFRLRRNALGERPQDAALESGPRVQGGYLGAVGVAY